MFIFMTCKCKVRERERERMPLAEGTHFALAFIIELFVRRPGSSFAWRSNFVYFRSPLANNFIFCVTLERLFGVFFFETTSELSRSVERRVSNVTKVDISKTVAIRNLFIYLPADGCIEWPNMSNA